MLIEQATGPCKKISNPIKIAREGKLPADEEESKETTEQSDDFFGLDEDENRELIEQIRQSTKASNKAKAEFFDGIQFQFKLDSVQLKVISKERKIKREGFLQPNLHFSLNNVHLLARFNRTNFNFDFGVKSIQAFSY